MYTQMKHAKLAIKCIRGTFLNRLIGAVVFELTNVLIFVIKQLTVILILVKSFPVFFHDIN
jgi:hypothetical protein